MCGIVHLCCQRAERASTRAHNTAGTRHLCDVIAQGLVHMCAHSVPPMCMRVGVQAQERAGLVLVGCFLASLGDFSPIFVF